MKVFTPWSVIASLPLPLPMHITITDIYKNIFLQVYLAAIAGHVPSEMVKCLAAFLNFCYTVRQNVLTTDDLETLKKVLTRFHQR